MTNFSLDCSAKPVLRHKNIHMFSSQVYPLAAARPQYSGFPKYVLNPVLQSIVYLCSPLRKPLCRSDDRHDFYIILRFVPHDVQAFFHFFQGKPVRNKPTWHQVLSGKPLQRIMPVIRRFMGKGRIPSTRDGKLIPQDFPVA